MVCVIFDIEFQEHTDQEGRKEEEGGGWMEGREGQKCGIYMTGAIGYGELSWINSLFTLAGRLLSEAGEVGASGDPALCYGERRAGKQSPQMTGRNVTWNNAVILHNSSVHHH